MSISFNSSYIHCSKAGCGVSLEQTEGQCRQKHNCGEDRCPLEGQFGQPTFARALEHILPGFQAGWGPDQKR
jgi:hypothetical protein